MRDDTKNGCVADYMCSCSFAFEIAIRLRRLKKTSFKILFSLVSSSQTFVALFFFKVALGKLGDYYLIFRQTVNNEKFSRELSLILTSHITCQVCLFVCFIQKGEVIGC